MSMTKAARHEALDALSTAMDVVLEHGAASGVDDDEVDAALTTMHAVGVAIAAGLPVRECPTEWLG